jgi:hypothetical protein
MDQISLHNRYLGGYVYHDKGQELRCGQDQESRQTVGPYAHTEFGAKKLQNRSAIFYLFSALIVLWFQQSCAIPKKPGNVTIQNCYQCPVSEVSNK